MRLIDADEFEKVIREWFTLSRDGYMDENDILWKLSHAPIISSMKLNNEQEARLMNMIAKAKGIEWIPVSERLPKDRRECLVTAYWHERYQTMVGCYWGKNEWWCVPWNNTGNAQRELHVIAWMPLPTPYEGGQNDSNV